MNCSMAKTILIVDDSASLRAVVKLTLERASHRVLEAGDGLEALRQLECTPKVHLIISDVNLPNLDGIAFVRKLKKHPHHKFIPVILLTTENQAQKKDEGRAAGAKAWILKSFKATQLLEAVARLGLTSSAESASSQTRCACKAEALTPRRFAGPLKAPGLPRSRTETDPSARKVPCRAPTARQRLTPIRRPGQNCPGSKR